MLQICKGLKKIRNAFAQTRGTGEEDVKGLGIGRAGGVKVAQLDAVGDEVELGGGDAHLEEGAQGDAGGDGDGVGLGVDGFFAGGVAGVGDGA